MRVVPVDTSSLPHMARTSPETHEYHIPIYLPVVVVVPM